MNQKLPFLVRISLVCGGTVDVGKETLQQAEDMVAGYAKAVLSGGSITIQGGDGRVFINAKHVTRMTAGEWPR